MDKKWFAPHVAYSMAKYGMSLCTLGWAEEFRKDGIAVNSLWPRTAIATAAIKMVGGDAVMNASRVPEIMSDAAHVILCKPSREFSGNFCIDDVVLHETGVRDFRNTRRCRARPSRNSRRTSSCRTICRSFTDARSRLERRCGGRAQAALLLCRGPQSTGLTDDVPLAPATRKLFAVRHRGRSCAPEGGVRAAVACPSPGSRACAVGRGGGGRSQRERRVSVPQEGTARDRRAAQEIGRAHV